MLTRPSIAIVLFVALALMGSAPSRADHGSSGEPLRVLLVGSSSMKGALGNVLESSLLAWSDVKVYRAAVGSSGIARPDYFDWVTEIARLKDTIRPHVVIINLGANDAQGIWTPKGWIRWGRPQWRVEFQRRVETVLDSLRGRRVFWVGPPNMRNPQMSEKLAVISLLIESSVGRARHAEFVDAFSLTSDDRGEYVEALVDTRGETIQSRTDDGVHFTRHGARLIASRILEPLSSEVREVREEGANRRGAAGGPREWVAVPER